MFQKVPDSSRILKSTSSALEFIKISIFAVEQRSGLGGTHCDSASSFAAFPLSLYLGLTLVALDHVRIGVTHRDPLVVPCPFEETTPLQVRHRLPFVPAVRT